MQIRNNPRNIYHKSNPSCRLRCVPTISISWVITKKRLVLFLFRNIDTQAFFLVDICSSNADGERVYGDIHHNQITHQQSRMKKFQIRDRNTSSPSRNSLLLNFEKICIPETVHPGLDIPPEWQRCTNLPSRGRERRISLINLGRRGHRKATMSLSWGKVMWNNAVDDREGMRMFLCCVSFRDLVWIESRL
jgi:hypothetical protein